MTRIFCRELRTLRGDSAPPRAVLLYVVMVATLCGEGGRALAQPMPVTAGQHPQSFLEVKTNMVRAAYQLYLPKGYAAAQAAWPLLLFLHGAGERGNDLNQVEKHGPPKRIAKNAKEFPFVIVSPQCPQDGWWGSETQIETLGPSRIGVGVGISQIPFVYMTGNPRKRLVPLRQVGPAVWASYKN